MKRDTIQRKASLDTISEIGHASIKSIFEWSKALPSIL